MASALSDLRSYDDVCTINRGVDYLNDVASLAKSQTQAKAAVGAASAPITPAAPKLPGS
jgi:hypothetical protein